MSYTHKTTRKKGMTLSDIQAAIDVAARVQPDDCIVRVSTTWAGGIRSITFTDQLAEDEGADESV